MTLATAALRGPLRKRESHLWTRDINDWYVEPIWCSERLFEVEDFAGGVWDPACGSGRIVESALCANIPAMGSDLIDRGMGPEVDFLDEPLAIFPHIVSNPPFGIAEKFVAHALELAIGKVAMLLPANWVQGDKRSRWLATTPLLRVLFITPRPSMPPGAAIAAGQKPGNGTADYCWMIWLRGYDGKPELGWLRRDA